MRARWLVVMLFAILTACQPDAIQPAQPAGFTPLPNAATRDALQGTAHVLALTATVTPSATITDTAPAPTVSPTALATAAAVSQDSVVIESFAPTSYRVRSTANARSCPDTQCPSLGKLQAGETITVDGGGHGGDFKGSNVWVRTNINGQVAYVHSSLVIEAALVSQSQQVQSTVAPVSVPGFTCPSNCTEARAMGLTEEQAGTCSNLDRDGDHKACYEDQ